MPELTNLLSSDRVRALSRDYRFRVATVAASFLAFLILVHGALLLPSYLYLSEEVKTRQAHLDTLSASLASSEERAISERLAALSTDSERLIALTKVPTASAAITAVLAVPSEGVSITGLSISPPESGEGQMRVMGIASTRESLQRYHKALSALPFVSKADLPLSVYAEEADITFSIAIMGSLKP